MSEFPQNAEFEQDGLIELASIIAQRHVKESLWQTEVVSKVYPQLQNPPTEVLQNIQTSLTVAMLTALEQPNKTGVYDIVQPAIDSETIANLIRATGIEPTDRLIAQGRFEIESFARANASFNSSEDDVLDLKNMVNAAKLVAYEKAVTTADVFAEDDLYDDCIRSAYTPETFTERTTAQIERINMANTMTALEGLVDARLRVDVDNTGLTIDEYKNTKEEMLRILAEDQEIQADLRKSLELIRYARKELLVKMLQRFWGEQAADEIDRLQVELTAEQPIGALPAAYRAQQEQNDVVDTLCMERGWDSSSLSVAQMNGLYNDPSMARFK